MKKEEELKKLGMDEEAIKYIIENDIEIKPQEIIPKPKIIPLKQETKPQKIEREPTTPEDSAERAFNLIHKNTALTPYDAKICKISRINHQVKKIDNYELTKIFNRWKFEEEISINKDINRPFDVEKEYNKILEYEKNIELEEKNKKLKEEQEKKLKKDEEIKNLQESNEKLKKIVKVKKQHEKSTEDHLNYLKENLLILKLKLKLIREKIQPFYPLYSGMEGEKEYLDLKTKEDNLCYIEESIKKELFLIKLKEKFSDKEKQIEKTGILDNYTQRKILH